MSSTYSSNLRIELIGSGDQPGAWGSTTDSNFANIFDVAIAGYQAVTITSTSQLLTSLNGPTASAALNQSVYAMLKFNSASAATNVFAPPVSKSYIVWNNSGYAITLYNSAVINVIPSPITTTGVTIANGDKVMVWSDGTNFYELQAANLTNTLAVAKGGTGATSFTSGALLKGAGTAAVSAASAADIAGQIGTLPVANGGTGVTTRTALGNLFYPVGSIYSSTVSTDPGTSLGFGTWTQFGAGRMMMGAGGAFSPGTTGGSADAITVAHTHTISGSTGAMSANASHSHTWNYGVETDDSGSGGSSNEFTQTPGSFAPGNPIAYTNIDHTHGVGTLANSTVGSSGTNANLPPYIVVYMWQRTA